MTTTPSQAELLSGGILRPGNTNCAGCGMSIGLQWLEQALEGEDRKSTRLNSSHS